MDALPRIAVIGMGQMGHAIARNFLNAGYEVCVHNRRRHKALGLVDEGAISAATPHQAAAFADIIFEVTFDDDSALGVFCNADTGLLIHAGPGKTFISSSTLSPTCARSLGEMCEERGADYFDIPMTGGPLGAQMGTMKMMAGGDAEKFERLKPILEVISSEQLYCGEVGNGMKFKLCLDIVQYAHIAVMGDITRNVHSLGLPTQDIGKFFVNTPGGGPTAVAWEHFQSPPDTPGFTVNMILKDLLYAREMFDQLEVDPFQKPIVLDVMIESLQRAVTRGLGRADAVTTMVRSLP